MALRYKLDQITKDAAVGWDYAKWERMLNDYQKYIVREQQLAKAKNSFDATWRREYLGRWMDELAVEVEVLPPEWGPVCL